MKRALLERIGDLLYYMPRKKTRLIQIANLNLIDFEKLFSLMIKANLCKKEEMIYSRTPQGEIYLKHYLWLMRALGLSPINTKEITPF